MLALTSPPPSLSFYRSRHIDIPNKVIRLRLVLLCILLALPSLTLLAEDHLDTLLDDLITRSDLTAALVEASAGMAGPEHALSVLAIGHEWAASAEDRVKRLLPLIEDRRQIARSQMAATLSIAEGCARLTDDAQAESLLGYLDKQPFDDLHRSARGGILAQIALNRGRLGEARNHLRQAWTDFRRAVPESHYETWHSKTIRRRLDRLRRLIDRAAALDQGGEHYLAWLQADRNGSVTAYRHLIERHPGTLHAQAARLEIARHHLRRHDPQTCIQELRSDPVLMQGPLAVPALRLLGEAALVLDQPGPARATFERALDLLLVGPVDPAGLDERMRATLLPDKPVHDLSGVRPLWATRKTGEIWAPALRADLLAFERYQLAMRLAVVAYHQRKRPLAISWAQSIATFDPVDRAMLDMGANPGSTLLAHMCEHDSFMIPLQETLPALPRSLHLRYLMAAAAFQAYDWGQTRRWMLLVNHEAQQLPFVARAGVVTLLAASERNLRNHPRSLELVRSVQLGRGDKPNEAWFLAREIERQLHMFPAQGTEDYEGGQATMRQVQAQAPGTVFAQEALAREALYAMSRDLNEAKRLFQRYRRLYPRDRVQAIEGLLAEIDERIQAEQSTSAQESQP